MCMSVYTCEYRCFLRPEMTNPPAAGVTGSCQSPSVGARNQAQPLSKGSNTQLLNHLSSPKLDYS